MLNEVDTLPENVRFNRATFSPEDGKLRLYLNTGGGEKLRVERDSYEYLRKVGYVSTPKQECSFVAPWRVAAEDAALALIPEDADIEDEDYSAADRSADRAERFGEYRDKRRSEAMGAAGIHSGMDSVYGNQNLARAQSYARRRDRLGSYAMTQWGKAEYWQERTRGVISAALYKLKPGVRRARLKRLETELRKVEKTRDESLGRWRAWKIIAEIQDPDQQTRVAKTTCQDYYARFQHPDHPNEDFANTSLYSLMEPYREGLFRPITGAEAAAMVLAQYPENGPCGEGTNVQRWIEHLNNRIAYERSMIEAEGGMAGEVEMVIGGWIGDRQIWKINKSSATGRVVSVGLLSRAGYDDWGMATKNPRIVNVNIERLGESVYREPTEEELRTFDERREQLKAEVPSLGTVPLLNPTPEDANRLVAIWSKRREAARKIGDQEVKPVSVIQMTKADWKGYSRHDLYRTIFVTPEGVGTVRNTNGIFRIRVKSGFWTDDSPIVLTDSGTKPLPLDWESIESGIGQPAVKETVQA